MRSSKWFERNGTERHFPTKSRRDKPVVQWEALAPAERRSLQPVTSAKSRLKNSTDPIDNLSILADLRERRMLTEAEFKDQTSKVLGVRKARTGGRSFISLIAVSAAIVGVVVFASFTTPSASTKVNIAMTAASTFSGESIVNAAAAEAGRPYCFDGGTPNGPSQGSCGSGTVGFDCTGLTLYAVYQASGHTISLPHDSAQASAALADGGQVISNQADLAPGDLVYFGGSLSDFEHAGVYAGGGEFWDANDYGIPVQEHSLAWEQGGTGGLHFVGGVRLWSSAPTSTPSNPSTSSSAPTHAETAGGVTHTWTNSSNAGGNEGPNIHVPPDGSDRVCRPGFQGGGRQHVVVPDCFSPWNDCYYVSADAFYNNGQTRAA